VFAVIFILISIQAFQIVSVRSAFALTPEHKDEPFAHPPPPEQKDETGDEIALALQHGFLSPDPAEGLQIHEPGLQFH
jgi:hypothetical protein